MGKIVQGILGGVSGTVGSVVGMIRHGIAYIRGKNTCFNDRKSEQQTAQRNRFKACAAIAKLVKDSIIQPIWNKKAGKLPGNINGYNLFFKTNWSVFDGTGVVTDFANLKFSVGDLSLPNSLAIQNDPAVSGAMLVTWEDNSGIGSAVSSDRLRVVLYTPDRLVVMSGLTFTRDAEQASIQLPFGAGEAVHVYVFFEDAANENYSGSFYALVNIPTVPNP
jgi:hypothetical protein